MIKLKVLFLLLATFSTLSASTYYIDFVGGADSNNGTAKATPWKNHPYMTGWTGSYSHSAGDIFIFKGGVTWTSAIFLWDITSGGNSGTHDLYTIDQTWYNGGAFTKPIFDGQHTATLLVRLDASYLTFDHLELKGLHAPDNGCCYMNFYFTGRNYRYNLAVCLYSRLGLRSC